MDTKRDAWGDRQTNDTPRTADNDQISPAWWSVYMTDRSFVSPWRTPALDKYELQFNM